MPKFKSLKQGNVFSFTFDSPYRELFLKTSEGYVSLNTGICFKDESQPASKKIQIYDMFWEIK